MKILRAYFLLLFTMMAFNSNGQDWDSYFTGNNTNIVTNPSGGVCLMGGASEDDQAMTWFLQRANGGDVLVLRASGSDGYNDYMYNELGVNVNSVETIVFNNSVASGSLYILDKIQQAEAIWFAGGDQWNYISYWRNTAISNAINDALEQRNIVIGGTSAGMAILGGYYFSAQYGTVTSAAALSNPYTTNMTVDSEDFLHVTHMEDVITDTHYDDPDRRGRHTAFLAKILTDHGVEAKGIACDEYTAVCISPNGTARVYGGYPTYDDNAYFIQVNCALENVNPEICQAGEALNWNHNGQAVKVYQVKGTSNGSNSFSLNNWQTGNGGTWHNWYVDNGTFMNFESTEIDCSPVGIKEVFANDKLHVFPNPFREDFNISLDPKTSYKYRITDLTGKIVLQGESQSTNTLTLDLTKADAGIYILMLESETQSLYSKIIKKNAKK